MKSKRLLLILDDRRRRRRQFTEWKKDRFSSGSSAYDGIECFRGLSNYPVRRDLQLTRDMEKYSFILL